MIRALGPLGLVGCLTQLPEVDDPCAAFDDPGMYRFDVETEERTRKPFVYVPPGAGPRDLLVLLHGGGSSAPDVQEVTGYTAAADEQGFVLVVPNGLGFPLRTWNAGDGPDVDADDVGFLDTLVSDLRPRVCGDRTLGVGFSNGGMMAHRWACEGNQADAISSVAGPLLVDACEGPPRPVLHWHGTADKVVPVDGGRSAGVDFPPVTDTMDTWRVRNQCAPEPRDAVTEGDTTCTVYDCAASTELCLVENWPHRW
ncbi:MAG: hypothetical protein AAF211_22270, partial [Myxococcota bacterium]